MLFRSKDGQMYETKGYWALYHVQDSHHEPFISNNHHTGPFTGHRVVKLGSTSGKKTDPVSLSSIRTTNLGLIIDIKTHWS